MYFLANYENTYLLSKNKEFAKKIRKTILFYQVIRQTLHR